MDFKEKTILIVSPQRWEGQHVSKHHYAVELSKMGNNVYFLEPPSTNKNVTIESTGVPDLKVVKYSLSFNRKLRFHAGFLFDLLIKKDLQKVLNRIGSIDIVWCFEPNLYKDLNWFGAKLKIYHPVDQLEYQKQIKIGETADIIFTVAHNIFDKFNEIERPKFIVNHGLGKYFVDAKFSYWEHKESLEFAYVGNVCLETIDHKSLTEIISKYKNVKFSFFGNISCQTEFISFLKQSENVKLRGIVSPQELATELNQFDGFLICYRPDIELNNGSNTHKLLEYLSTGRVVISNSISFYKDQVKLFAMAKKMDNSDYVELFEDVVSNILTYNSAESHEKRRNYSLDNTYTRQIDRIAGHINKELGLE